MFADECALPDNYVDEAARQELLLSIAAVPFTVRLGFENDAYGERTRPIVRLISPTFDGKQGMKHPLQSVLTFPSDCAGIPPCRLNETVFNEGIGMALLHDSVVDNFRVFVKITDNARGMKRPAPGSDLLKVTRRAVCMLQDSEAVSPVPIIQNAELEEASRFLQVPQDGHVHAIVSRRDLDALTLVSFWMIPNAEVAQFLAFFRREVDIFDKTQGAGGKHEAPAFESPLRIAKAASEMSSGSAKLAWSEREKLDLADFGASGGA